MIGDIEKQLQAQVVDAMQSGKPLAITGGESKSFYGRKIVGEPILIGPHSGVVDYHPSELVITARAGTPLTEIIELLDQNNQMLGFEPPQFSRFATLGGAIAAGLSGSIRPYSGSVNHFVLGLKVLTGHGEILRFGGRVIKNVAGFDVSRLMVGSMGCLGILLEISLKVVPKPVAEQTVIIEHADPDESITLMNQLAGKPIPISGASWVNGETRIRISGSDVAVDEARRSIGGGRDSHGNEFWLAINNQTHEFFHNAPMLLRGSVTPGSKMFCAAKNQLIDWGGGLRWTVCDEVDSAFEQAVNGVDGHLTCFRNGDRKSEVFAALPSAIMKFHQNLKNQFDPTRILNPGRMYAEL